MSLINDALKRAKQAQKSEPIRAGAELQPTDSNRGAGSPVPIILVVVLLLGGGLAYFFWPKAGGGGKGAQGVVTNSVAKQAPLAAPAKTSNAAPGSLARTLTDPFAKVAALSNSIAAREQRETGEFVAPAAPKPAAGSNLAPAAVVTVAPVAAATHAPPTAGTGATAPGNPASRPPTADKKAVSMVTEKRNSGSSSPAVPKAKAVTKPGVEAVAFPEFKIQGIFYRLSKPSAIINGTTVFVGDVIEGATVTRIERRSVELEMAGQKKVLGL